VLSGLVFFGWGQIFSLFPSTLTDTFGTQYATTNYGFLYMAQGVGSIFGAPVAAMIYEASTWVLPVIFAVTLHEAAHGFVAHRFGDDTALQAGRVSANPLKHVDPFGTIILPAMLILLRSPFLFGYAKPVPVNFRRLDRPRRDMVWVALAGPGTNVLLAIVSSVRNHPLPRGLFAFGEIGLAGEIRPAPRGQERLREAAKLGFAHAIIPRANAPKRAIEGLEIVAVDRLEQALEAIKKR